MCIVNIFVCIPFFFPVMFYYTGSRYRFYLCNMQIRQNLIPAFDLRDHTSKLSRNRSSRNHRRLDLRAHLLICIVFQVHPETNDQIILIGAEEGIYTLNLNYIHDSTMDLLYARRCTWLHVMKDVMMSLCGRTPQLYRHDLLLLLSKQTARFSLPMNKIPMGR